MYVQDRMMFQRNQPPMLATSEMTLVSVFECVSMNLYRRKKKETSALSAASGTCGKEGKGVENNVL